MVKKSRYFEKCRDEKCPEIILERMRRCKVPEMNKLNDEFL